MTADRGASAPKRNGPRPRQRISQYRRERRNDDGRPEIEKCVGARRCRRTCANSAGGGRSRDDGRRGRGPRKCPARRSRASSKSERSDDATGFDCRSPGARGRGRQCAQSNRRERHHTCRRRQNGGGPIRQDRRRIRQRPRRQRTGRRHPGSGRCRTGATADRSATARDGTAYCHQRAATGRGGAGDRYRNGHACICWRARRNRSAGQRTRQGGRQRRRHGEFSRARRQGCGDQRITRDLQRRIGSANRFRQNESCARIGQPNGREPDHEQYFVRRSGERTIDQRHRVAAARPTATGWRAGSGLRCRGRQRARRWRPRRTGQQRHQCCGGFGRRRAADRSGWWQRHGKCRAKPRCPDGEYEPDARRHAQHR